MRNQTGENIFSGVLAAAHENLLHDDSVALSAWCDELRKAGGGTVDLIVDNAYVRFVLAVDKICNHPAIIKKALPTLTGSAFYWKDIFLTADPAAFCNPRILVVAAYLFQIYQ